MARLHVLLMGPLQVMLDSKLVTNFESSKVYGLLAYLAAGAALPHSREVVAEMLWPERPHPASRANLRHSLANLRHVIGDYAATSPFLISTSSTLQFNAASSAFVDFLYFEALLNRAPGSAPLVDACRQAVELYRGPFLHEFPLDNEPGFGEWLVAMRERLARDMTRALTILAQDAAQNGEFGAAAEWARRHIELEPWNEEMHRCLLAWLAMSGQRSAALHHFAVCSRLLADESGIGLEPETVELARRIREQSSPFRGEEAEGARVKRISTQQ